jgi:3-hydroxyacyl-CoA dehydrogenase
MTEKIAIVGAGLVGSAWAIVFARAGFEVALYDSVGGAATAAREVIAARLSDLKAFGLVTNEQDVLSRVSVAADLRSALGGAIYAQESAYEQVDLKRDLFSQIDSAIGPGTLVGSSSSGIPSSAFTEHVSCRDRVLIAHPVNPPYLVPVVELVPAPWTRPEVVKAVRALMERIGQSPVEMTREVEGFILNRLQAVLLMEAWRLVEAGLATVEDIDLTISHGLGLRWSFMGPFETIDLNAPGGVADYARRFGPLYQRIAASCSEQRVWSDDLIERVEQQRRKKLSAADLPKRSAWRDRKLMELAKHRADQR